MIRAEQSPGEPREPPPAAEQARPAAPEVLPLDAMIILPVRKMVLFPGFIAPVAIDRAGSIAAAQEAVRQDRKLGLLLQRDASVDQPAGEDMHLVGTAANVVRYVTAPDGSHHLVCQGEQRFRVIEFLPGHPFLLARVELLEDHVAQSPELEARAQRLKARTAELLELLPDASPELAGTVQSMASAAELANFLASLLDMKVEDKQALLENGEVEQRLDRLLVFLGERIEVLRLSRKIDQETKGRINEQQRQFLLREQLKTIQQELGEHDEDQSGIDDLTAALDAAGLPEEADKLARKELRRLARMNEGAAEYSMLRTYLEWLAELPWSALSEDSIDIAAARRTLDEDHCGLAKVKRRILEYLAVHKLNPAGRGPILCFAGPPGVGKTSLGQSIARATGRKFARVSLGGVHDEAEIRGHRRTYVGALPGNIVQALRKAGRQPRFRRHRFRQHCRRNPLRP
jgi:ATP-dependent Lon protease